MERKVTVALTREEWMTVSTALMLALEYVKDPARTSYEIDGYSDVAEKAAMINNRICDAAFLYECFRLEEVKG